MDTLSTRDLVGLVASVGALSPAVDDADRIDRIRHFEELTAAIAAAQARTAVEFDTSQRAEQAAAKVPPEQVGRGVAGQLALARRVSPWQAQRWLGWAKILTAELPDTYAELAAGRTTQWRSMLIARETAALSREDRAVVDAELASQLAGWGDRRVERETRAAAYRLDPGAAVERARRAEADRRVGLRPAPDTMCWLGALLPVAQGVAAYAALARAADTTTAAGDERGRGQIMADTLVERLTGRSSAPDVPVEINLVMTDETLFGRDAGDASDASGADSGSAAASGEPGWIDGYGPVPAGWARELAYGRAQDLGAARWIRRLYQDHGSLVAMESTRRLFTPAQQRFLRLRDRTCRTPWCDAPIRHSDHVWPHARGGPTATSNGQGLCQACNHARQAPGWRSRTGRDGAITTRTPTGHRHRTPLPSITGPPGSPLEDELRRLLSTA